jgi:hypothetical protein
VEGEKRGWKNQVAVKLFFEGGHHYRCAVDVERIIQLGFKD